MITPPYKKYILPKSTPQNAVIPPISEEYSGEKNSEIINSCIALTASGGAVIIKKGTFKVSTIRLKSCMTLFLTEGARLVGLSCEENINCGSPLKDAVISADGCRDITITGGGEICGSGTSYTNEPKHATELQPLEYFNLYERVVAARQRIRFAKTRQRPKLLLLRKCENVKIESVILKDSAEWTLVLDKCKNVRILNCAILNLRHTANTDGIDVCSSQNVKIKNCYICTADDAIVIKTPSAPVFDVEIEACALSSFANCFKIGTETQFPVGGIRVKKCEFFMPEGIVGGYAGIAIESADGADIYDISVKDIKMRGISSPLLIWLGSRLRYSKKTVGSIKNVVIEDIDCRDVELPCAITGCRFEGKDYAVEDVTLSRISVKYRDSKERLNVKYDVGEESMSGYPEITRISHFYREPHEKSDYFDLPCSFLFMRLIKNVRLTELSCMPRKCSSLPQILFRK